MIQPKLQQRNDIRRSHALFSFQRAIFRQRRIIANLPPEVNPMRIGQSSQKNRPILQLHVRGCGASGTLALAFRGVKPVGKKPPGLPKSLSWCGISPAKATRDGPGAPSRRHRSAPLSRTPHASRPCPGPGRNLLMGMDFRSLGGQDLQLGAILDRVGFRVVSSCSAGSEVGHR